MASEPRPYGLRLTSAEAWELWKALNALVGTDHCTPEEVKAVELRLRKKVGFDHG